MNRRTAIGALGGAALAARAALSQKPGRTPLLCVYSGNLSKIPYSELADIVRQMGYDGVDLTVMKGGHVDPSVYMVHLDRAFQTFHDAGLDLPMVTTSFTSASQPFAYQIFYVSAAFGAKFCRLGTWPPPPAPDDAGQNAMQAVTLRGVLAQFAATGRQCRIMPLLANHAGSFPGRSIPETEELISGMVPGAFGYCFDPAQAVIEGKTADAWEPALRTALPRLGALALSDVTLEKAGARLCALGEGVIDWKKFFSILAAARFNGPVSLHMEYETRNDVNSMTKDLAFARARVDEAWKA